MALLTPAELLRMVSMRPQLRAVVLPLEQAVEDATGKKVVLTSGVRSYEQQAVLYANRGNNPYPVAVPGTSRHEYGAAGDFQIINGTDADYATMAEIAEGTFGLTSLWPDDPVHVQLNETLAESQAAWRHVLEERSQFISKVVIGGLVLYALYDAQNQQHHFNSR